MLQQLTANYIQKEMNEARGNDEVATKRILSLPERRSAKVPISQ